MKRGDLFVGPFPYAALDGSKRRPVCLVSSEEHNAVNDPIVAMVTSRKRVLSAPAVGDVIVGDFVSAGLLAPSVIRAGRLFSVEARLLRRIGRIDRPDQAALDAALRRVLGLGDGGPVELFPTER